MNKPRLMTAGRQRLKRVILVLVAALAVCQLGSAAETARVLIVVGPSRHPPGSHEVAAGGRVIKHCLEHMANVPGVRADLVDDWPQEKALREAASTVVFIGDTFPPNRFPNAKRNLAELDAMMKRGCGIVCIHYATGLRADDVADDGEHPLLHWMGGYFATRCKHHQSVARVYPAATITPAAPQHPVSRGWREFTLPDEPYTNNYFSKHGNQPARNVTVLATSMLPPEMAKRETVAWGVERADGGRGFGVVMLHYFKNWGHEDLRRFVLNGIVWTAKLDVPAEGVTTRLPDLATFKPDSVDYVPPPPRQPNSAARKPAPNAPVERVKALCRSYTEGFVSPATELAYGKRLNGPRGIAVLERPEEVARGRVQGQQRPWGYGSGIEDPAYQTGMLLFALCDAEEATGDVYFAELARRACRGLSRMSTLSPVEGFVPRGPHPADGKAYYRDSSLDQHSLYVCGLWRYYRSRLASAAEKGTIRAIVGKVIRRLEKAHWVVQVEDGSVAAHAGGSMLRQESSTATLLLMMLAAAHDVTGDPHWKDEYDRFSREENGRRWTLLAKEIDRSRERRYTMFLNQHIVRMETLRRIEPSAERKAILRRRIEATAEDMLSAPYFHAWRSLDWLGEESWAEASQKEVANAYLQPLGVTVDSAVTVMDLWRKFDVSRLSPPALRGRRNRYEPIALATPAMVWQIAMLAQQPELIRQVQPAVREMLERVDFGKIDLGWAYNYSVLAALWSLRTSD